MRKNSNIFSGALKEFYFLHFLQATAVLICLSIHFLLAGTFTLYLAHFKRGQLDCIDTKSHSRALFTIP